MPVTLLKKIRFGVSDEASAAEVAGAGALATSGAQGMMSAAMVSKLALLPDGGVDLSTVPLKANNLSDMASASTCRTNLGLGTAATQATGAFDAAGAASTAQAAAIASAASDATTKANAAQAAAIAVSCQRASNLSDVASVSTARTNLGLGTASLANTGTSSGNVPVLGGSGKLSAGVIPALASTDLSDTANLARLNSANSFNLAQTLARLIVTDQFSADPDFGFRVVNGVSDGSAGRWNLTNAAVALALGAAKMVGWSAGESYDTKDTGVGRNAAGVVEANNGTLGTLRDFKAREFIGGIIGESRDFNFDIHAIDARWVLEDGRALLRADYATLFARIGTTFGAGDASTTFNIPDTQGRVNVGSGMGAGLTARAIGDTSGVEAHTLETSEMPAHVHAFTSHETNVLVAADGMGVLALTPDTFTPDTQSTGGDGSHENMQPFAVKGRYIYTGVVTA